MEDESRTIFLKNCPTASPEACHRVAGWEPGGGGVCPQTPDPVADQ